MNLRVKFRNYSVASEATLAAVENKIGTRLPSDYRKFLQQFDKAAVEDNFLAKHKDICINRFIPIAESSIRASNIEGLPSDCLPIAECPSGDVIYLRFSDMGYYFWDHEVESGDRLLASSFLELVESLVSDDSEIVKLDPDQVEHVWVDRNFKPKF